MYEQYVLKCKNPYCSAYLRLPSDQLWIEGNVHDPVCYGSNVEPTWPPDEWQAEVACLRCRQVRRCDANDVDAVHSDDRLEQTKCLSVKMGCANPACKVAFQFFIVEIDDLYYSRASGDDLILGSDFIELLRDGQIQGKCPRGHPFGRLPRELYKVTPRSGTIPPQFDELHWIKHSSRLIDTENNLRTRHEARGYPATRPPHSHGSDHRPGKLR